MSPQSTVEESSVERFRRVLRTKDLELWTHVLRGMTLVDVVVGVAIMLTVFLAIFGSFKIAIDLVLSTKAKAGALSLITRQMEYLRGLPYDSLGTAGGIPSGTIPQLSQTTLNNIVYTTRTLIEYVDDPADGLDTADSNSITADYKRAKVEIDWSIRDSARSTFAVSTFAPPSIESLANGGTLRVNVFDALAAPVQGASVRIQNPSTTPAIDITVSSDVSGSVAFPGAPAAAGYRIKVGKSGYSSAQTYDATTQNPNPNPGHVAVANKKTTTASFAVDTLAAMTLLTFSPVGPGTYADTFTNQSGLSATSSVAVTGGALVLSGAPGSYPSFGSALSTPIEPQYLSEWTSLSWTASTSAQATAAIQLYYWNATTSSYTLVPDSIIPGNTGGLTVSPVGLAALPATYSKLEIGTNFATTNASSTPSILDWTLAYRAGPTPLPNVTLSMHGAKAIGTTAGGVPIYKVDQDVTTNAGGQWATSTTEWDTYTVAPTGAAYDVIERCPNTISVAPSANLSVSFTLGAHTTNSLRVAVSGGGNALPGAAVSITGGASRSGTTSTCGQTYFDALPATNYTVTTSAAGYQNHVDTIAVSGATELSVPLSP